METEGKIKEIISKQLGVDMDKVTQEASFMDDLGYIKNKSGN
jgi:acyl carrier protein